MPFDQKISSPSIYTPGAGEMTIPIYSSMVPIISSVLASISNGKVIPTRLPPFFTESCSADRPIAQAYGAVLLPSGRMLLIAYGDGTAGNQMMCMASDDGGNYWFRIASIANAGCTTFLRNASDGRLMTWPAPYYSTNDGVTWNAMTGQPSPSSGGACCNDAGIYLAWGSNNWQSVQLYRSTNGTSWSAVAGMTAVRCAVWSPAAGKFFCTFQDNTRSDRGKIMWSSDGLTWADSIDYTTGCGNLGGNGPANILNGIATGNKILLPSGKPFISLDAGATWSNASGTAVDYFCRLFSVNGGNIVITSITSGYGHNYPFRVSYDFGNNWTVIGGSNALAQGEGSWKPINFLKVSDRKVYLFACVAGATAADAKLVRTTFDIDVVPVATLTTANAFQPTAPAKLASLPSAVLTLDTTGAAGTVALYLQHYNDEVGRWESYSGVANDESDSSFTLIGSYSSITNNIDLPALPARAGEKVRCRLKFTSTDGTAPAPAFVSLSLSWTSDITAPDAPTKPTLQAASETSVVMNLNSLPSGARNMIVEVDSGAGYLPISSRGLVENGYGYLKFRPGNLAVQSQGEFNLQTFILTGYSAGTTVTVRSKTEDNVGNLSDWVVSDPVTTATLLPIQTPKITIDDIVLQTGDTSVLKVHRNGISDKVITFDYTFVADTATTPEDFTPASGTITFGIDISNPHAYQEIAINATGTDPKPDSVQYKVVLSNPTNATIEKAEGIVEIQNFDVIPYPTKTWNQTWKANRRWNVTWNQ